MQRIRQRVVDGVDLGVRDDVLVGRQNALDAVFFGEGLGAPRIACGDGHQPVAELRRRADDGESAIRDAPHPDAKRHTGWLTRPAPRASERGWPARRAPAPRRAAHHRGWCPAPGRTSRRTRCRAMPRRYRRCRRRPGPAACTCPCDGFGVGQFARPHTGGEGGVDVLEMDVRDPVGHRPASPPGPCHRSAGGRCPGTAGSPSPPGPGHLGTGLDHGADMGMQHGQHAALGGGSGHRSRLASSSATAVIEVGRESYPSDPVAAASTRTSGPGTPPTRRAARRCRARDRGRRRAAPPGRTCPRSSARTSSSAVSSAGSEGRKPSGPEFGGRQSHVAHLGQYPFGAS